MHYWLLGRWMAASLREDTSNMPFYDSLISSLISSIPTSDKQTLLSQLIKKRQACSIERHPICDIICGRNRCWVAPVWRKSLLFVNVPATKIKFSKSQNLSVWPICPEESISHDCWGEYEYFLLLRVEILICVFLAEAVTDFLQSICRVCFVL